MTRTLPHVAHNTVSRFESPLNLPQSCGRSIAPRALRANSKMVYGDTTQASEVDTRPFRRVSPWGPGIKDEQPNGQRSCEPGKSGGRP